MSKTPKFSACGGLNSKNNSIIFSLSVKDGILITFEYKSPRSGGKKIRLFSPRSGENFLGCFFYPNSKVKKKHWWVTVQMCLAIQLDILFIPGREAGFVSHRTPRNRRTVPTLPTGSCQDVWAINRRESG